MLDWAAVINLIFAAAFIFLVVWAMVSDATRLVIPNWISLCLVGQFFAFALLIEAEVSILFHSGVAVLIFGLAFTAYSMNWMAGGDVKLITALALWAGPAHTLPMMLITSLAGMSLGLMVRVGCYYLSWHRADEAVTGLNRYFPHWLRRGLVPYGIAIGIGALSVVPRMFF